MTAFEEKYVNKIICGDCLEVMKDFPHGEIPLVATDPPYGIMKKEFNWENLSDNFHQQWLGITFCKLNMGGALYSFFSQTHIPIFQEALIEADLDLRNIIVWHYRNNTGGYKGFLSGKHCYVKRWQPIFYATKGKPNISPRTKWQRYGKTNYDVFVFAAPQSTFGDTKEHPMQKPLALMMQVILASSNENDIVLDPFCGSGTTCVAAKKLGRRYIGIDISEDYCQIAEERLKSIDTGVPFKEARAGQQALFE